MVCRLGASKPVSHMSRTITILNGSFGSRKRSARSSRRGLLRMCGCQSSGSDAEPVITTLSAPCSSSSPCQAGRSATISRYSSTQMRRLMHTTIALPSIVGEPVLEVLDQVAGDQLDPVLGADHRFELRPPGS